jgi:GT2 family glycosyltransferase
MSTALLAQRVGLVAIGRNEGERLVRALKSVRDQVAVIVYVDSGSTDQSVANARQLGAEVVELDRAVPFTAARARNLGWEHLTAGHPEIELIQFIDGDCELDGGWLPGAIAELSQDTNLAVVAGRRRERHRNDTIYNRLCDIEWDTPVGEAKAVGGDALMRVAALKQVGGFDPTLIAGEEPELCVRIRQHGWSIRRLALDMTWHDAAMTRFGQWWKRTVRAGHAYAEGAARHGRPPERHWVRESRSIWLWGLVVPVIAMLLAPFTHGLSLALFGIYGLLAFRVLQYARRRHLAWLDAAAYAVFTVLGKFPQVVGQMKFYWHQLLGRPSQLIEYKGPAA